MWLLVIISAIVLCLFLVLTAKWKNKVVQPAVMEQYIASPVEPIESIIQDYNTNLESIQSLIAEQNNTIDTINRSTYRTDVVDQKIDDVRNEVSATGRSLSTKLLNLEGEMQGYAHRTYADATYAKVQDVDQRLSNYVAASTFNSRLDEASKYAETTFLSKDVARATYVDKNQVFQMNSDLSALNTKLNSLETGQNEVHEQIPLFATKSDLATYARYSDFSDVNTRLNSQMDRTNNLQTAINDVVAVQSRNNASVTNSIQDINTRIMGLDYEQQEIVNQLGNYLTADAITGLLQSSYAPLSSFNALDQEVDSVTSRVNTLDARTDNVERDLRFKDSSLCLTDGTDTTCMNHSDFEMLKAIMDRYYVDQEHDSTRLKELEARSSKSDTYIKLVEQELRDSKAERARLAQQQELDKQKIWNDAEEANRLLRNQLTSSIMQVKADSDSVSNQLRSQLVEEEKRLAGERKRLSALNDQLSSLQNTLSSVQVVDQEQSNTITYLKEVIETFEQQKKNLNETIRNQADDIFSLRKKNTEQETQLVYQESVIEKTTNELDACNVIKIKCTQEDYPKCDRERADKQLSIEQLERDLEREQSDHNVCKTSFAQLDVNYKALEKACAVKITQDQCDAQSRQSLRYTLRRIDPEESILTTNITVRNVSVYSEFMRLLATAQDAAVDAALVEANDVDRAKLMDYKFVSNRSNYEWILVDTNANDTNNDAELVRLRKEVEKNWNLSEENKTKYETCNMSLGEKESELGTCNTDLNICRNDKSAVEDERNTAIRNKCKDCNYTGIVKAYASVDDPGMPDDNTVKVFCYNSSDHLTSLERKQNASNNRDENISWMTVDPVHKPNWEAKVRSLRKQLELAGSAPQWVKFHGYPTGSATVGGRTTVQNIEECKRLCNDTPSCSMYTFNRETKACDLKQNIPIFEEPLVETFIADMSEVNTQRADVPYADNMMSNWIGEFKSNDRYNYQERSNLPPRDCVMKYTEGPCDPVTGKTTSTPTIVQSAARGGMPCDTKVIEKPCPVDCKYEESDWGPACPVGCSDEQVRQKKTITITSPARNGGLPCPTKLEDTRLCELPKCPKNCKLSDWSAWSECLADCGKGIKRRTKTILEYPMYGGEACPDEKDLVQTEQCDTGKSCDRDCKYSDWGSWGKCDAKCGNGKKTRTRTIISEAEGKGKPCSEADKTMTDDCLGPVSCPDDCETSEWTKWTDCSAPCGPGIQTRTRTITSDAFGKSCDKETYGEVSCELKKCPVNCTTGPWGAWGPCKGTCPAKGTQERTREKVIWEANEGVCNERLTDYQDCDNQCPVDCVSQWGPWGACDEGGSGKQRRKLEIITQAKNNGKACGDPVEERDCKDCVLKRVVLGPSNLNLLNRNTGAKCSQFCGGGVTMVRYDIEQPKTGEGKCVVPGGGGEVEEACNTLTCGWVSVFPDYDLGGNGYKYMQGPMEPEGRHFDMRDQGMNDVMKSFELSPYSSVTFYDDVGFTANPVPYTVTNTSKTESLRVNNVTDRGIRINAMSSLTISSLQTIM